MSSLDDVKSSSSQTDSNAAKTMALDHLGVIAARIRTSVLKFQKEKEAGGRKVLKPLDEVGGLSLFVFFPSFPLRLGWLRLIVLGDFVDCVECELESSQSVLGRSPECGCSSVEEVFGGPGVRRESVHIPFSTYASCLLFLTITNSSQSARELTAATLGYELAAALKQVHGWMESPEGDEDLDLNSNMNSNSNSNVNMNSKDRDPKKLQAFGQRLKLALREVWKDGAGDVFDIGCAFIITSFIFICTPGLC